MDDELQTEIAFLLAAGWSWVGNRLTHPKDDAVWRTYDPTTNQRTFCPKWIEQCQQLDAEFDQAARLRGLDAIEGKIWSLPRPCQFAVDVSWETIDQKQPFR